MSKAIYYLCLIQVMVGGHLFIKAFKEFNVAWAIVMSLVGLLNIYMGAKDLKLKE